MSLPGPPGPPAWLSRSQAVRALRARRPTAQGGCSEGQRQDGVDEMNTPSERIAEKSGSWSVNRKGRSALLGLHTRSTNKLDQQEEGTSPLHRPCYLPGFWVLVSQRRGVHTIPTCTYHNSHMYTHTYAHPPTHTHMHIGHRSED